MKAGDLRLLTGDIAHAIIEKDGKFIAWTRTSEGKPRPDYAAAAADLRDVITKESKWPRA